MLLSRVTVLVLPPNAGAAGTTTATPEAIAAAMAMEESTGKACEAVSQLKRRTKN